MLSKCIPCKGMCLRPRFIYVSKDKTSIHKQNAYRNLISKTYPELRQRVEPYWMNKVQVPCGSCSECLRARQSDLASRVALAAKDAGNMWFVTLTYDEENFPISARKLLVDKSTGECFLDNVPVSLCRLKRGVKPLFNEYYVSKFREELSKMERKSQARVLMVDSEDILYHDGLVDYKFSLQGFSTMYAITPSLHRRDVRMWMKRCRVEYERDRGEKLPDFKYVLAGEFGPRTCRPHYHLLLFGNLQKHHVHYLLAKWTYGFTYLEHVKATNPDGSSGYALVAKYVSKYIMKGDFEADSVKMGYAEKPRVCLSRYIGTSIPSELVDYFRCYDLFGHYDLDTLIVAETNSELSLDQLMVLYNEFRKRAVLRFGSSWLPLPKVIIRQLFSVPDTYYSISKQKDVGYVRQSLVQMAFGSFVESDFLSDFVAELQQSRSSLSDAEISDAISNFLQAECASRSIKDETGEKNFRKFYSRSKF